MYIFSHENIYETRRKRELSSQSRRFIVYFSMCLFKYIVIWGYSSVG